jgi:hypothetical protein
MLQIPLKLLVDKHIGFGFERILDARRKARNLL